MYLKREFLISVLLVVLAGFSFGKEIYFLGSSYTLDNLYPNDQYYDTSSLPAQTALMSTIGGFFDTFKGDEFGFLGSIAGGFGSHANFAGNSYSKNVFDEAYHIDVLIGAGYFKEIQKVYFVLGGGVGLVVATLDFERSLNLPIFLSQGVGPGIYGGVGYSITNRFSIFFNTKVIYTLIGVLPADIPFKPTLMVAPAFGIGIAMN
ncbi:MAG: hypothetical protein AB1404_05845 [Spirochaetota bacterium]